MAAPVRFSLLMYARMPEQAFQGIHPCSTERMLGRQGTKQPLCLTIPTASRADKLDWVVAASHCLNSQIDTVKEILIVCGISNSLDGRENKLARAPPELPSFTVAYGVEQAGLFLSSEEYNVDEESDVKVLNSCVWTHAYTHTKSANVLNDEKQC